MKAQTDLFSRLGRRPDSTIRVAPFRRESQTSRAAAAAVRPKAKTQRDRVLEFLRLYPAGRTMHEVAEGLRIPLSSVCGRYSELRELGLIEETGRKRETPSGAMAAVWRSIPEPKGIRGREAEPSDLPGEAWGQFRDWPYEVSDLGRVRRMEDGRGVPAGWVLTPRETSCGYLDIRLRRGSPSRSKRFLVHQLVAEVFVGPRPEGMQVNHVNGVKTDNRAHNLEYVTPSENLLHASKNGLAVRGVLNGRSKLDREKVREIRRRFSEGGVTKAQLADQYGVSRTVIRHVIVRKSWKHVR